MSFYKVFNVESKLERVDSSKDWQEYLCGRIEQIIDYNNNNIPDEGDVALFTWGKGRLLGKLENVLEYSDSEQLVNDGWIKNNANLSESPVDYYGKTQSKTRMAIESIVQSSARFNNFEKEAFARIGSALGDHPVISGLVIAALYKLSKHPATAPFMKGAIAIYSLGSTLYMSADIAGFTQERGKYWLDATLGMLGGAKDATIFSEKITAGAEAKLSTLINSVSWFNNNAGMVPVAEGAGTIGGDIALENVAANYFGNEPSLVNSLVPATITNTMLAVTDEKTGGSKIIENANEIPKYQKVTWNDTERLFDSLKEATGKIESGEDTIDARKSATRLLNEIWEDGKSFKLHPRQVYKTLESFEKYMDNYDNILEFGSLYRETGTGVLDLNIRVAKAAKALNADSIYPEEEAEVIRKLIVQWKTDLSGDETVIRRLNKLLSEVDNIVASDTKHWDKMKALSKVRWQKLDKAIGGTPSRLRSGGQRVGDGSRLRRGR